jgi:glycogen debranching enzyme
MTEDTQQQQLPDYYILATNARADERTRVLKHGDSFGVFDRAGTIRPTGLGELGLYHDGTRFLSGFELALERRRPLLLGSTVRRDDVLIVDLANPDITEGRECPLERDTVHVFVSSVLWERAWHARVRILSYHAQPLELELSMLFAADYADVFEVRGVQRARRGKHLEPTVDRDHVVLGYEGLDHIKRRTRISFSPAPAYLSMSRASYRLKLQPRTETVIDVRIAFEIDHLAAAPVSYDVAAAESSRELEARRAGSSSIASSDPRFDEWMDRSANDMRMMLTRTPYGDYPYAGVPWFSAAFGRDGILSAWEMLWLDPSIARGVLGYLAATQATELVAEQDAEPGKIIHEVRPGEMPTLGEVPFGRYYGSLDATPLFVMLAGAYWRRTADIAFLSALWPNIERALEWIDQYGDRDGDGFVEYARRTSKGLVTQSWKDSHDSMSHESGVLAEGPIAPLEVQAYVYAARMAAAQLATVLGFLERAGVLMRQAAELRDRFERQFWCEDLSTYALALDGDKRQLRVRSSNAGHALFAGIADRERARRVVATLFDERSFSGWGIRTLDAGARRYNPISYHNGSVWPHDNALIAMGLARYGHKHEAARLLAGLFDASMHFDLNRVPELFCGFRRRDHEGPTWYPVACSPQAWAAGAPFLMLQACLGLDIDAAASRIVLDHPVLPASLRHVAIRNLRVGNAVADMELENHGFDVAVYIARREGQLEVATLK